MHDADPSQNSHLPPLIPGVGPKRGRPQADTRLPGFEFRSSVSDFLGLVVPIVANLSGRDHQPSYERAS